MLPIQAGGSRTPGLTGKGNRSPGEIQRTTIFVRHDFHSIRITDQRGLEGRSRGADIVSAADPFNRTGQGSYWAAEDSSTHGVHVSGFISGAYGYRLPIIVKREWNDIPEADKYGGCLFVVDNRNARRRPMRNRDTKLLTQRQGPGVDGEVNEYLTESSWQFAQEKTHGLIYGVTSIAP